MNSNKFNKLLKEYKNNLQKIIYMYCNNKIYLTNKQLNYVIEKRGKR